MVITRVGNFVPSMSGVTPLAEESTTPPSSAKNPRVLQHTTSALHRRRTLYLVRHGEAVHNVLEAKAQAQALVEAQALQLSDEETKALQEERRKAVLHDVSLQDAPLTDNGRQQAFECGKRLQQLIDEGRVHAPTEAMVSPLHRTMETCEILLDTVNPDIKAHIRPEIQERITLLPPDTVRKRGSLFRCMEDKSGRFIMNFTNRDVLEECQARESQEMLRERAAKLFHLLMEMEHRHLLIVSHKGYLRELERGLLGLTDSPLFGNAELRVYRVIFTKGARTLESVERLV